MREVVLDASVVLKWFTDEPDSRTARAYRDSYSKAELRVVVPSILGLEVLNVAGTRWKWTPEALGDLAVALEDLDFEVFDPDLSAIVSWVVRGLSAYDAAYVALAEDRGVPMVTADRKVAQIAAGVATTLQ